MSSDQRPLVIIGTGLAGYSVVRAYRQRDSSGKLLLITADDGAAYSRAQFPFALSASQEARELVLATAEQMAYRFDISVRTRTRVIRVERGERVLVTDRAMVPYSRLVLACGAEPLRPTTLRGSAVDQVLTLSSLDEYRYLRHELAGRRRVTLLGGDVAGCEFADHLVRAGCAVNLFEPGSRLLGERLPTLCASRLARLLGRTGVRITLEDGLARVDQGEDGLLLTTLSGARFATDVVIAVLGSRPRIDLARAAGLAVGRGIQVDAGLCSSDPDIFAVGRCAELGGKLFEAPDDIESGARIVAERLAGAPAAMRWRPRLHRLQVEACPIVLCEPPPVSGEWQETATPKGVRAFFHDRHGDCRGFALVGDTVDQAEAEFRRVI